MYMYNDVLREAKERHRPGHPEMGVSKDRQWGGVGGVGGRGLRSAWVVVSIYGVRSTVAPMHVYCVFVTPFYLCLTAIPYLHYCTFCTSKIIGIPIFDL